MGNITDNQINLFNDNNIDLISTPKIEIINATFNQVQRRSWEELFNGFDELYAITFSSGIDFVNKVISHFRYSEIIFGCEGVLNNETSAIIAMQTKAIEKYVSRKSAKEMAERMDSGLLKLFVSRDTKSHEKIFVLKADDGRTRVITGSANMSSSAFCGLQRENVLCFDDQQAYDYYNNLFISFREACSDEISQKTIVATIEDPEYLEDNIEEVPIFKTLDSKRMIFLEESGEDEEDEVEIVASIKGFEKELKPLIPKQEKERGKLMLSGNIIPEIKRKNKESREIKKHKEKKLPKLHVDYENKELSFNGKKIELHPSADSIHNDVKYLLNYYNGFSSFNGNVEQSKKDYFQFMCWYFASIFMPSLRLVASRNNYDMTPFPVVGIIYGDSNGGKSTFTKFLSKMMCGHKIPMNSSNDFTSTEIDKLKCGREGLPIIIDDLAKAQFQNHNEKIIKEDEWGLAEKMIYYPSIAITTNKLPYISPDISKRAVTCHIDSKINKEIGAKNSKKINESMKLVSTAFYGEYAKRMLEEIEKMKDLMKTSDDYFPDIFKVSSDIICSIIEETGESLPSYMSRLTYSDYFGDKAVSRNAIEKLLRAWENEPKQFKVDRKANKLIYSCPENGRFHELKYIQEELPPSLNAQLNATNIVMDLDQTEALFDRKLKKGLFDLIS